MASYTPNVNLKKPADGDAYDIADANGNMDAIDTAIGSLRESVSQLIKIVTVSVSKALTAGTVTQYIADITVPNGYTALFAVARSTGINTTVTGGCYFPNATQVSASVYANSAMSNCIVRFDVFCLRNM